ncbi:MAG: phosphatase domain-containing protein [bacterium]
MFIDEAEINATRRQVYIERIQAAIERIRVIDGIDALGLATDLVGSFEFALRNHLAEWSRVALKPQLGIGTQEWIRVRGRVAERSKVAMPGPDDEPFDIFVSCWYRFLISKQPLTPVLVKRGGNEVLTSTDEEGFFDAVISAQPDLGDLDYQTEIDLGDQAMVRAERVTGRCLVPHPNALVGIVADLDGLVLNHPTQRFSQCVGELVLGEAQRLRTPLEGADRFLQRAQQGMAAPNPVFYVSNAPRHLSKHLEYAARYAKFPEGYLHLRDHDLRLRKLTTEHVNVIEMMLTHDLVDQYPHLPFVFVGTRQRATFYEPLINALCHRLSAVYLIGEDGLPDNIRALSDELGIECVCGGGDRLLMHMVQRGWANA